MFRTLEFTAWGLKTSTGVTGFRLISTQGIEMVELSATSRSLLLGRKSVALLRIALEHVYTPYLAARALDRLEVWLLGYRVLLATKHLNSSPRSAVFNLVVLLQKSLSFRTFSTSAASWFSKVSTRQWQKYFKFSQHRSRDTFWRSKTLVLW